MSSLFTVAEEELSRLGLAAHVGAGPLDVLVGGLGLGYTARAALEDPRVASLVVVEALPAVIDWHRHDLLPDTVGLAADTRVELRLGSFFAVVQDPARSWDAILLDIDHSPRHVLHPSHEAFYTEAGLAQVGATLRPGGVFALWSDDPPDEPFVALLRRVFADAQAHIVPFANVLTGGESANTVYLSTTSG